MTFGLYEYITALCSYGDRYYHIMLYLELQ